MSRVFGQLHRRNCPKTGDYLRQSKLGHLVPAVPAQVCWPDEGKSAPCVCTVDLKINLAYAVLMNTSTQADLRSGQAGRLLESLRASARQRFASDAQWARASGVPKETLSRLGTRLSCDSRTLWALVNGAGCSLVAVPVVVQAAAGEDDVSRKSFYRDYESSLLDLCASGNTDTAFWRAHGPAFFMAGLATLLAGSDGFDRQRYLRLAESLHLGVTTPEVFGLWLKKSPARPARFLPMLRARRLMQPAHATRA